MKAAMTRVLAFLAVVLLLAAAVFGMLLWQRADERALLKDAHVRPLGENELGPDASRIPLVAALWDEALYMELMLNTNDWYESEPGEALREAYLGLAQSGVLPQSGCLVEVRRSLEAEYSMRQVGAFISYDGLKLYNNTLAVSATVPVTDTEYFDLDSALQSYLVYLGLDVLEDWQPAATFQAEGVQAAEMYSPSAQLLVQLTRESRYDGTYRCGVYPLPRAEFARRNMEEE